jgi:hypothetical protein
MFAAVLLLPRLANKRRIGKTNFRLPAVVVQGSARKQLESELDQLYYDTAI